MLYLTRTVDTLKHSTLNRWVRWEGSALGGECFMTDQRGDLVCG